MKFGDELLVMEIGCEEKSECEVCLLDDEIGEVDLFNDVVFECLVVSGY